METSNAKFISIETSAGGSGSWSNIYGIYNEKPFSPEISGKYGGFGIKDGKYIVVLNDFSKGYHDYVDTELEYNSGKREFKIKNSTKQ